jgi:hypothetical protein
VKKQTAGKKPQPKKHTEKRQTFTSFLFKLISGVAITPQTVPGSVSTMVASSGTVRAGEVSGLPGPLPAGPLLGRSATASFEAGGPAPRVLWSGTGQGRGRHFGREILVGADTSPPFH